ncbi:lipopolysaccharide export system protein LptC [Dongia mobilis]|uniref:Lipopolysaccharide export system protein LptC n=1 Tax=Dongia mobilis TaxID=578943 RepID=A0A4R6WQR8_9PROT|nr:LPS export ABC transporter periplasmic protein LptC [Dongia mobilis]TDQ82126.1 lipopolysaccharide export system protein LptC [Dongia mobilis]
MAIGEDKTGKSDAAQATSGQATSASATSGGIQRLRGETRGPVVSQPRALFNRRRPRFVWLKILLPIVAIATVAYLGLWSYRQISETRITVEAVETPPLVDTGMKVSGIAFEGRNKSDRPFSVTALTATETTDNKDLIRLEEPQAQIELSESSWFAVTARSGMFDRQHERVELDGAVTIYHDNGMTFVTEKALIDLTTNDASSPVRVTGSDERRELTAEGFELLENGRVVLFKGQSHMKIMPKQRESDG